MFGEELSVKVSANVADATAGLNRVEDNLEEVGDEANDTSRSFATLSASAGGLTASLGTVSAVTTATAIPAFATLSTVAAPLSVVFGGLAAAAGSVAAVFGGLAATGVVTHMDKLKSAMADAREEILRIIQPLGQIFGPVLVDAVEALPTLVQAIVDSLGPLDRFRQTFIRMGETAMRLIPQLTAGMFDLATRALPVLNQALSALTSQGPGVFQRLVGVFNQVFPLVQDLASALAGLGPKILDFGTTVATAVLPAATQLTNVLSGVVDRVNDLSPGMRKVIISAVTLAPALSALVGVLSGLSAPILAVGAALGTLGAAYQANLFGFRDAVQSIVPSLSELKTAGEDAFSSLQTAVQETAEFMQPVTDETIAYGEALTETAESITGAFVPGMESLRTSVEGAQGPIQDFAKAGRSALRGYIQFLQSFVLPAYEFAFTRVIAPVTNEAARAIGNNLGPVFDELGETIQAVSGYARTLGGVMQSVWKTIKPVVLPIITAIGNALGTLLVANINATSQALMGLLNLIQGDWGEAATNFENSITSVTSAVGELATELGSGFADGITALGTILGNWLSDGVSWLDNRANDAIQSLKTSLSDFGDWMETQLANALDFAQVASDAITEMGTSFANGIESIASDIAGFGADVGNALIDAINEAVPNELSFSIDAIKVEGQTVVPSQTISANIPNNPIPSAKTGGFISEGGMLNVHQGERVVPAAQVQDRGSVEVQGGGKTEVEVVDVSGEVELDEGHVLRLTDMKIQEKERRAKRQTGGTTGL